MEHKRPARTLTLRYVLHGKSDVGSSQKSPQAAPQTLCLAVEVQAESSPSTEHRERVGSGWAEGLHGKPRHGGEGGGAGRLEIWLSRSEKAGGAEGREAASSWREANRPVQNLPGAGGEAGKRLGRGSRSRSWRSSPRVGAHTHTFTPRRTGRSTSRSCFALTFKHRCGKKAQSHFQSTPPRCAEANDGEASASRLCSEASKASPTGELVTPAATGGKSLG